LSSSTRQNRSRPIKWFAKKFQWDCVDFLNSEWFDEEDKKKVLPELEYLRNFIENDNSGVRFRTNEKDLAYKYIMQGFEKID
jgi:hypothetical protein